MVQDSVPLPSASNGVVIDPFWLPGLSAWRSPKWSSKVRSTPVHVSRKIRNSIRKSKQQPATALTSPVSKARLTNEPFAHWKAAAYGLAQRVQVGTLFIHSFILYSTCSSGGGRYWLDNVLADLYTAL